MSRELIDVACQQHHETDRAFLVSDDGERDTAVWLPKSQVERGDAKGGGAAPSTAAQRRNGRRFGVDAGTAHSGIEAKARYGGRSPRPMTARIAARQAER